MEFGSTLREIRTPEGGEGLAVYAGRDTARPGAAVFTDPSGRRSTWVRRILAAAVVVGIGYLGLVSLALVRGGSAPAMPAPRLPAHAVTHVLAPGVAVTLPILPPQTPAPAPAPAR